MLDAAGKLEDLRIRTQSAMKLKGDRDGNSAFINDQYRICFAWEDGNAYKVELVDYHSRHTMIIARKGLRIESSSGRFCETNFSPMKMSAYQLAKRSFTFRLRAWNDIVLQKRGITADTAVRLAKFFGTSEQFWLSLQAAYEVSDVVSRTQARNRPWQSSSFHLTRHTRHDSVLLGACGG
jgi:addiction module HigA family antidote